MTFPFSSPNFCQSNLVWSRALPPGSAPRNLVFFFKLLSSKSYSQQCHGCLLLGGRGRPTLLRGGGNSLGTMLPASLAVPGAQPPEAGAGPLCQCQRGPGRTWSGAVRRAWTGERGGLRSAWHRYRGHAASQFPERAFRGGGGVGGFQSASLISEPRHEGGEGCCLAPIPPPRLTHPSPEPGRGVGSEGAQPRRLGGRAAAADPLPDERLALRPGRVARFARRHLPSRVATHPPGSRPAPPSVPGAWAPTCHGPCPGPGEGCHAGKKKGGETHRRCCLWGCKGGPQGCAFQGSWEACAGRGAPRGPCSLRLDWSPASNPSPRVEGGGGGGTSRKKKKKALLTQTRSK